MGALFFTLENPYTTYEIIPIIMNTEYATNDLCQVVTLHHLSIPISRVDSSNPKKIIFYFENSPTLERVLNEYSSFHLLVEPVKFFQTIKTVKSIIHAAKKR